MIGTIETKQQQLTKGYYSIGNGSEVVLIMGSCRAVPYLNFFNDWNKTFNRFTICFIDPFNWNWDINNERVDYDKALAQCESNEDLLKMLRTATIFIHEYYVNAGMFNVNRIKDFGLNPKIDICLPNFNDLFILTADIVSFDMDIKKKAIADYNVSGKLSERTLIDIENIRQTNLDKFYSICAKSSLPEFAEIFRLNYKLKRFFWTSNHIGVAFSKAIYKLMNGKYLHLQEHILNDVDMYANNYTHLTEYDKDFHFKEDVKPLKTYLF